MTAHSELAIASNNFAVEVYQGAFLEFLGQLAYINVVFGILHALNAAETFLGFAKLPPSSKND